MLDNNLTARAIYECPMPPTDREGWKGIVQKGRWSDESIVALQKTIDARAMNETIQYGMAWNFRQACNFFGQEGFAGFDGFEIPEDQLAQTTLIMEVLQFVAAQHHLDPENQANARRLVSLLNIVFGSMFLRERHQLNERAGELIWSGSGYHVTETRIEKIRLICVHMAVLFGESASQLFNQVMEITAGGWHVLAALAVSNYQTTVCLRAALIEIGKLGRDSIYPDALKLAHPLAAILVKCGLGLDGYLKAAGYPTTEALLFALDVIAGDNPALVEALQKEAPRATREVSEALVTEVLAEAASTCGFPERPETQEIIASRCQQVESYVNGLLPISGPSVPAAILWPTAIGARTRGVNITYYNPLDQQVNVIIMDPRVQVTRLTETYGHEEGHRIHAIVALAGEKAGIFPTLAWEKIPMAAKEWFALGIGESVRAAFSQDNPMGLSRASGLSKALAEAHQPGFARVQLESWQYLCSRDPNSPISDRMIMDLMTQQYLSVGEVSTIVAGNLRLTRPDAHPLGFFAPARPFDGLAYCVHRTRAITNQPTQTGNEVNQSLGLDQLMTELCDETTWIKLPKARQLLVIGMMASATDPSGVMDEIRACHADRQRLRLTLDALSSWGITVG